MTDLVQKAEPLGMLNWLADAEKFTTAKGETIYCGPCPFDWDKNDHDHYEALWNRPWVISHPDARDKLWKCTGIESFCIMKISKGTAIGVRVVPWENEPKQGVLYGND